MFVLKFLSESLKTRVQCIFFADTTGLFKRPRNTSKWFIFSFILSSIFYSTLSVEYIYTVITLAI